jgi:predicted phosphate transport protein (TIGR00153 family)
MLSWFDALMPKERGFFDLFDRHAALLQLGAGDLRAMLEGRIDVASACRSINKHEEAADEIVRETSMHLRRTFITPFDRSDIQGLTNTLDDAIDQMQKVARTITVFDVRGFDPGMREFGEVIDRSANLTVEAVGLLRKVNRNGSRLTEISEEINALEHRADDVHQNALRALYEGKGRQDAMAYVVGEDVYDHLEKVMDRFEDVSDRISGIVVDSF